MAKQSVNIGSTANDGTGSPLRSAFDFINDNTDEIYSLLGDGTNLSISGDVTMSAGAVTIADDAVTGAKIADNVALAGSPTTTTQSAGDNSTKIATTAYADTAVANAIDAAPAALDTLNELAASLNDDADFAGTMTTALAGKLSTANGAVGTANLAADAVDGTKIADDAIDSEHIAADSIDAEHYAAGSVDTTALGADSVTNAKIADDSIDSEHYVDGSIDAAHIASSAVTNAKINNGAVNMDKLSSTIVVTESEGIGSNDNDTTLPTSAAVKDYVDTEVGAISDNDTLGALTATDGGFVVGDGTNFVIETGSTARDSIGLGTSGHIQFHCLGVGQAASTNNGQIDATTVYATTFGKDSGDKIEFTTDTQIDFTVNGNNEMRLEADGDLHVDGDVFAASTTVSSDERLKDNIATYKNAIDTLKELKGVSFEWKKDGKKSGGVIAQDVEKVLPELVGTKKALKGEKETLTVDYNGLVGVLIQAVKELSHKVEKLEKR